MANPRRAVLVDGSSLVFRAYHAIPGNLSTAAGLHTNAIFGFAMMFRKLFAGRKPDVGAVVFDPRGETFRRKQYPQYKAQRPSMAGELAEQLPWIDRLVEANRFPMLRVDGWEADDVIGTLAARAVAAGMEVLIVSADKDFAQLVTDGVRMVDTLRDVTYDPGLVFKKWGVRPDQMIDLLALMGDTVDNIPGVEGIGQKGAAALLGKYGSLAGIYDRLEELPPRQRTALGSHRGEAMLSQDLATIRTDAPVGCALDDLAIPPTDPSVLNALYRELEFFSLLSEEARAADASEEPAPYELARSAEEADAAAHALAADAPVVVRAVHDLPSAVTGTLAGVVLAGGSGSTGYVPAAFLPALRWLLEDATVPKIGHDVKATWIALRRAGIELRGVIGDTQLASFLIDPTKLIPHRLSEVVKEYLHRTLPPWKRVTGSGQEERAITALPPEAVAEQACREASAIAALWPILEKHVAEAGLATHLVDHDLALSRVLGRMELDGIRVDAADLHRIGEEFGARLAEYERDIHAAAGRAFNIGSTKQLAAVLFEELKLPVVKKTKTGYSTDSEVLERLAGKHEIARLLLEHRKLAKLINTYTDVLQRAVNPSTGRIHATFEQTTGATGRLITTDPDLQRTPVRSAEGRRIRKAFIAADGCVLLSADWSQIELRVLAHVSQDPLLLDSFRSGADVHRRTAAQLFGCDPSSVTPEQRNIGKTVNFATIYGQGATALGQILDLPRKDAERYIEGYFAAYAGVRTWLDATIARAHERGYVETLLGRRRHIPELRSNNLPDRQAGERIAANTPIQGTAADLCKLAMLRIASELAARGLRSKMLLQIHDELVFECPTGELDAVRALVRAAMEQAHPLDVPLVVGIGAGPSWADAH